VIQEELQALGNRERAVQEKRYLKSDLAHLGVPVPAIRKVVTTELKRRPRTRLETLTLAEELWTDVHEYRIAAVEVLIRQVKLLESGDIHLAERLIRTSHAWAYVDALAEKVVGGLLLRDPALAATLDLWVADPDFWIRRTALLALLPGVRTGAPDVVRISRYGDALIEEKEFFIRKALGWVLRELSKKDPEWVRAWVADRIPMISGVTFREATRHLPADQRSALDGEYRARPRSSR
jgi:3-methyladenine DNA glycosylase AlkD